MEIDMITGKFLMSVLNECFVIRICSPRQYLKLYNPEDEIFRVFQHYMI